MFDWLKSRAALVAELREAREALEQEAVRGEEIRAADHGLVQDRAQAWKERDQARESLETVTRQRDAAWARIKQLRYEKADLAGESDPLCLSPEPRTPAQEVLLERARADALAERLASLQAASMARDRR